MRKVFYIVIVFIFSFGCSQDSQDSNFSEGNQDGQGGSLAIFALKGDYLYAVDEQDLTVFSIANPSDPVQVNQVQIGFRIETLFSYKEYLYIGSQNGMYIYSIENPEFPQQLSEVAHFTSCDPVVANETTAFVTLWSDIGCGNTVNQLEIYDVTNVEMPLLLSTRQLTFPKGLGLYGDYLFVCDDEIKVFDISAPSNSVLVHNINRLAFDVIIKDNLLIAIGDTGLYQYQLDPTNIQNTALLSSFTF
ncbi:LVIVD repeat-containing protein [Jejudonia soesokkakensis]|uniref:LVIVD repeat-containing protein n=1 Tax=Jejudonia soesokkakensis TaxID=1323432 RepID=A0ABW2MUT6_9FLAO